LKRPGVVRSIPFDMSLRDALGNRLRVLPDECAKFSIGGVAPKSVALPRTAAEAGLALAAAGAEGAIVALRGAGTKANRPPAPRSIDVVIDSTSLNGIVEHAAADLTVTVKAGTTLARLDEALAAAGQFWPCDAPFAATATVGGTIAASANGALRLRYGAIRDLLLGARMLTPGGVLVRTGARVVKSVAGYDLHKLLAGSFGTLGLIVEATLKVAPLPETEALVVARFSSPAFACAAARAISGSPLLPMAVTLHDDGAARRAGALLVHAVLGSWLLLVRCGGNRRAVARQTQGVIEYCEAHAAQATAVVDHAGVRRAWNDVRELSGGAQYHPEQFAIVKICALPSDVPAALGDLRAEWPSAELTAQPATGIVYAHVPLAANDRQTFSVSALFERCKGAQWSATVVSVPSGTRLCDPASSQSALPVRLIRAVKAAFDPAGVLDPGRLPGGV
jgi:glycolate dehydrogenase FAD-binding subunit